MQVLHASNRCANSSLHCICRFGMATSRVGNGYDQAQLRSIKMADVEYGEFRLSPIVSTWHLIRRPYCARGESWDRLIFWVWETAAAGWDIADSVGKTNKEPNHLLFVFRLAIIRKHKWDLCPSDVLWYLCSLHNTLTKRKTFVWSMLPLLRSETVIRKREIPPVHATFTA